MEFKDYRDSINHIFAYYIRRGFVDYYRCRGLGADMNSLMAEATLDLQGQGKFKELFDLANKGFLKWGKTDKDDSDGETQDFVSYVFDAWNVVYDSGDEKIDHDRMLKWFMKNMDGSVIDYMEDCLYEYMMDHFKEPELLKRKMNFLKEKIEMIESGGDDFQLRYYMPKYQIYVMTIMGELHYDIEEVRAYSATIKTYSVNEKLAEIELNYGNTLEAISLYEELADRGDSRWGRNEFREKLMYIYKGLGNHDKYFENLMKALHAGIGSMDLWEEYKSNYTSSEWSLVRDEFFSSITKPSSRACIWYDEEGRYDLIMDFVEVSKDIDQLKAYEKPLKKQYPERCLAVLCEGADKAAQDGNKRADYRRLARILSWIQKYPGGNEKSKELAEKYRKAYPRRRAMLEEISRF